MKISDGHYKCDAVGCPKEMVHPAPVWQNGGSHYCDEHKPNETPSKGNLQATLQETLERVAKKSAEIQYKPCDAEDCENETMPGQAFCESCTTKRSKRLRLRQLQEARAGKVDEIIAQKIGKDYVRCTFENLEIAAKTREMIYEALRGRRSVLLSGENGVGKTHCLTAIFRGLYLLGKSVAVYSAGELLDILRERTGQDYSSRKVVAEMRAVDWLLIDDLGEERLTDVVLEAFSRVIDWRSRDAAPVIITTNLSLVQIGEVYSHRIQSRIAGLIGDGVGIKFTGKDRRILRLKKGIRRD